MDDFALLRGRHRATAPIDGGTGAPLEPHAEHRKWSNSVPAPKAGR